MEAIIFPRWPSIFKETRVLPTLLLSGISYLTGDLLLREPPLGMQAAKSQSQPQHCYTVPTPPQHSGSLHIFEERLLQMCRESFLLTFKAAEDKLLFELLKCPKKHDRFEVFITLRMAFSTSECTLKAATRQISLTWLLAKLKN